MLKHIQNMRHTGLVVRDLGRCLDFYQNVLGLEVKSMRDESGSFLDTVLADAGIAVTTVKLAADSGETLLELLHFKSPAGIETGPGSPPSYHAFGFTHAAFTVYDMDQVCAAVIKAGGQSLSAPRLSADGTVRVAFCRDPEGNLLEMVQNI